MDDQYYQRAWRPGIQWSKPRILGDDAISANVRVVTKMYNNYRTMEKNPGAHIETLVISSDHRVKSRHVVHPPRDVKAAINTHECLVRGAKFLLGLITVEEKLC